MLEALQFRELNARVLSLGSEDRGNDLLIVRVFLFLDFELESLHQQSGL
jgi:hypothetical protein